MSKEYRPSPKAPGVLTANNLRDGRCVWMSADGWTTDPRRATVYDDGDLAEFALLEAQAQGHEVVGAYLVETLVTPDGPKPAHFRESFRQAGPSTEAAARSSAHSASTLREPAHV